MRTLVVLLVLSPLTPWIDLTITGLFYQGNGQFSDSAALQLIYTYGVIPANLTAAISGALLIGSLLYKRIAPYRPTLMYLLLTLAIGSGLITNALFKSQWGRPRPRQVEQFGGAFAFRPFYAPNFGKKSEPLRSFPCGHCTTGFYFFSFYFLGRRTSRRWLEWLGLVTSTSLGLALSLTRIMQGGHFFTDVVCGGIVMWMTAFWLERIIWRET